MPSRFLILHSFVGWPIIISIVYAIFSQFRTTQKFIKIFIFAILIIYSVQHYKNFIKVKNGFVLNISEESQVPDIDIFKNISNLNFDGYLITTSGTVNYANRYALKPILLDTHSLDFLPYHPYLLPRAFEILKDVYGVDIENPPNRYDPHIPDDFIKESFEDKEKSDWKLLEEKYNAGYVVVPTEWKIKLDLFKNNKSFSIYKIN